MADAKKFIPVPPPFPHPAAASCPCKAGVMNNSPPRGRSYVSVATRDLWERLFYEGYKADVFINTDNGGIIYAHSNILAMASPVMRGMLKQARRHRHMKSISISGVPHDAVRVFIRFLYSSCYEKEEMKGFVLHLLVLSHVFAVPHLKRECEQKLELDFLTIDNIVDVFQLALLCDAPRLSLICHRRILKNFKAVSESESPHRLRPHSREPEMAVRQRAVATLPNLIRSLRKDSPKPLNHALPSLRRTFSLYDQINLIDNVPEDQLRFQGYNDTGFTVNKVEYEGGLLCVGNLLLSWKPKKFSEITSDSLSVFQIVRPIPEILILGCGRHIQQVDPELRRFIRSTGMKLEAVDSRNAASTYNILNEEGRIVAAALLPYGVSS